MLSSLSLPETQTRTWGGSDLLSPRSLQIPIDECYECYEWRLGDDSRSAAHHFLRMQRSEAAVAVAVGQDYRAWLVGRPAIASKDKCDRAVALFSTQVSKYTRRIPPRVSGLVPTRDSHINYPGQITQVNSEHVYWIPRYLGKVGSLETARRGVSYSPCSSVTATWLAASVPNRRAVAFSTCRLKYLSSLASHITTGTACPSSFKPWQVGRVLLANLDGVLVFLVLRLHETPRPLPLHVILFHPVSLLKEPSIAACRTEPASPPPDQTLTRP
ncbi:hypothetical protein F4780DRAFT_251662 [Xylariomycetidae sp. FL0641]|nr:hypothetical protein F4780DRAFT_251662 [Xylariomycetidae sp. FL0641]